MRPVQDIAAMRGILWVALLLVIAGCQPTSKAPSPGAGPSKGKITVALCPKLKGIEYFNACEQGAREAAQELGNIDLIYDGPTEARADRQSEFVDNWAVQKVEVIGVACNDPDALAPALRRARQKGIHILTWDADANPKTSQREFFVNQASPEAIGRVLVDVMAKEAGPDAPVAIVTSSLTAPNQNEWIKWMRKRIAEKYPKMRILDIRPSEEKQELAFQVTQDLIKAYPEIKGIWGISSTAFPGAAEAVRQAGKKGKIAVTGLSTPNKMKPYVKDGTVKTVVLWNAVDLGYLTVYTAKALAEGTLKPGTTSLKAGRLGVVQVKGDQVLLGEPLLFTKENIDRYNF